VGLSHGIPNFLAYDVSTPDGETAVVALQDWNAYSGTAGRIARNVKHSSEGGESFLNPYNAQTCYIAHPDDGLFTSVDGCKTFTGRPRGGGIESLAFEPTTGTSIYAVKRAIRTRTSQ
jgi:hypothetical protein